MSAPGGDTSVLSPELQAERAVKQIADLAESEGLLFCPSTPDKCGGCEINPNAVAVLLPLYAEVARLRALLREQKAQELTDELRTAIESDAKYGPGGYLGALAEQAADLLSQLLAAPSTGGER